MRDSIVISSPDMKSGQGDILSGMPNPKQLNAAVVDLTIERIDSMHTFVNELLPGVTGALCLSGEGCLDVAAATLLKTSEDQARA